MNTSKVTLEKILKIIVKNIIIIIVFALIGGGGFYLFAKHKESTNYIAERSLTVNHRLDRAKSYSQFKTDLKMVPTYRDMIEGREVSDKAYHYLPKSVKKEINVQKMEGSISTINHPNSLVITVKANTSDAKQSAVIVNAIANATKEELPKLQRGIGGVHVYSKATQKNVEIVTHNPTKKYTLVGLALGIIAGMIFSFGETSFKEIN